MPDGLRSKLNLALPPKAGSLLRQRFRWQERSTVIIRIGVGCFCIFLSALLMACNASPGDDNHTGKTAKNDAGIHQTIERGPVIVDLDADKREISIADRLNLTLSVIYHEDYVVELPRLGEKLEEFGIVDYHTSPPELTGDRQLNVSRTYVLEPFLSGDYKIPAMTVSFRKKDAETEAWHEIQTNAVTVKVTSLLPENFKDMTLHDIMPPVDPPRSHGAWLWIGGASLALLISGMGVFLVLRQKNRNRNALQAVAIPAHQQAFDALNALVAENLVEKGRVKEFYQKISDILRRYIENRFHIRAPELTTEEFLIAIQAKDDFAAAHQVLLKNFLTHCDLVKFARHQPQTEDIQKTFDACKAFILGTQEPA